MSTRELLYTQDWKRLTLQLAAFAFRRTGRRSWDHAHDLAQEAITRTFTNPERWDPAVEPILKFLAKRVISLASNELRRRRNSFECEMDDELADTLGDGKDTPDESLDNQRYSEVFRRRLGERLQGDEIGLSLVVLMMEGVDELQDQGKALRLSMKKVAEARRRVHYHAEQISKELATEVDAEENEEVVS